MNIVKERGEEISDLFHPSSSHALEAASIRLVNLWHLVVVLGKLLGELGGVQTTVASAGLDDLALLLKCEVLPCEVGSDVLLEQAQDLVVRDSAWVGEVVDTGLVVFSHQDGGREEVVEDGVGVWDVNDTLVLGDLGDEVSGVEVVADRHAQSEDQAVLVGLHDLLDVCLGL